MSIEMICTIRDKKTKTIPVFLTIIWGLTVFYNVD